MSARWFMAVLVRGSRVDGEWDDGRMGDMLYRLVSASDAEAAYARALEIGSSVNETYTADDGKVVSLEFLGLADLTEIGMLELKDGAEVYSLLIADSPSGMVAQKEELSVFEPSLDDEDDDPEED